MRIPTQLLVASLAGALALLLGSASQAATAVSVFRGAVFIESTGAPVGTQVEALVGANLCAQSKTVPSPVDTGFGSIYSLVVPSANEKPGCGTEGAKVTFRV